MTDTPLNERAAEMLEAVISGTLSAFDDADIAAVAAELRAARGGHCAHCLGDIDEKGVKAQCPGLPAGPSQAAALDPAFGPDAVVFHGRQQAAGVDVAAWMETEADGLPYEQQAAAFILRATARKFREQAARQRGEGAIDLCRACHPERFADHYYPHTCSEPQGGGE